MYEVFADGDCECRMCRARRRDEFWRNMREMMWLAVIMGLLGGFLLGLTG